MRYKSFALQSWRKNRKKIDEQVGAEWYASYSKALTCSEIQSCEQAYFYYFLGSNRLDWDKDWIPCEILCSKK